MLSVSDTRLLLKARDILSENNRAYVCTALHFAAHEIGTHAAYMSCRKLKGYIDYSLGGHGSLESWQLEQGFKGGSHKRDRIAWITWMLGEEVMYETCKTGHP